MLKKQAAPKGFKALNAISHAQIKQEFFNQALQKKFLKESSQKKLLPTHLISKLESSLAVSYEAIPKNFYSKAKLAQYV